MTFSQAGSISQKNSKTSTEAEEEAEEEEDQEEQKISSAAGKLVCVTDDPKRTNHLVELDGAKERLHLFKANLLEESSFDAAIQGCDGVFHTSSPFYNDVKDPQDSGHWCWIHLKSVPIDDEFFCLLIKRTLDIGVGSRKHHQNAAQLLDPAVKGTLNVLKSCAKSPSVKRVVLTSSIAAVAYNGRPRTPDVVVDETWFSDPEICKAVKQWHVLSKTLAEEAAWKFSKEEGLDMVAINPAMVIGPLLQPTLNTSAGVISNLVNGAQVFPNLLLGWVNVKDVANAHIQAYEMPSASGRYCLVERVAHYSEIMRILRELYPSLQLPDNCSSFEVPLERVLEEQVCTRGIHGGSNDKHVVDDHPTSGLESPREICNMLKKKHEEAKEILVRA
ncbi:Tetraketide alpha-pyrone reductase 1 [Morella rubra]|uniref:Tetraketide alpha-pyrone reductase 1 n=1 Tax=Morella rubra TaxID=262757 RepID=A0A6A1WPA6_9ROSI|nr:Tetraketide alpha-pyrone reductase 1 [Morella rubra]